MWRWVLQSLKTLPQIYGNNLLAPWSYAPHEHFSALANPLWPLTFLGQLKSLLLKWCAQGNEFSLERRNILTIFHTIDFPLSRLAQPLGALRAPFNSWNRPEYRLGILAQIGPNISWTHHSWDSWILLVHWSNQMVQLRTHSAQTESEMQFLVYHIP